MEFEDEHDEELEEEEEEEEEEEITITQPSIPPSYDSVGTTTNTTTATNTNSVTQRRPPRLSINNNNINNNNLSVERRSGVVRYRECLKNHAVNIGGHALDGCCDFMPAGEEGTLDALKCAACNCHRNFHRKEIDQNVGGDSPAPPRVTPTQIHTTTPTSGAVAALYPPFTGYYRSATSAPPTGYLHVSAIAPQQQHRALGVVPSTSGGTHSGGGDVADDVSHPSSSGGGSSKKRYRTKFSQEQKDKMLGFAEKLGWRIQKHDEAVVQQFCAEIQVKRQVLKVWMHNNKHTLGKKP